MMSSAWMKVKYFLEIKALGTFEVIEYCVLEFSQKAMHFPSQANNSEKFPGPTFVLVVSELPQFQHQEMDPILPTKQNKTKPFYLFWLILSPFFLFLKIFLVQHIWN